jgi:hypothetical protein
VDRRVFLRAAGGAALGAIGTCAGLRPALAGTGLAHAGPTGFGSLDGRRPDRHGVVVPEGFRANLVATGGERVGRSGYVWHAFSDGAACIADGSGGWYYVANSEVADAGGASSIRFDGNGAVLGATRVLSGTSTNCSGGATPWGTWLSCEEIEHGFVWECDPTGRRPPRQRPALGELCHEAVAVDPIERVLYLTEDQTDGLFYRFVPDAWPSLEHGRLEALRVGADGVFDWVAVPQPTGWVVPTRGQVSDATRFDGGEGVWLVDRALYFTTKGDNVLHALDLRARHHRVVYDDADPLFGLDQIVVDPVGGNLFCAEDGGNMEINVITPAGQVGPFARVVGHDGSEISGLAFAPDASRLYFSSQRAPTAKRLRDLFADVDDDRPLGAVYEVIGPFSGAAGLAGARIVGRSDTDHFGGSHTPAAFGAAVGAGMVAAAAAIAWRQHRNG